MNKRIHATPAKPRSFCRDCGRDFGGDKAFDRHRVGQHEHRYSPEHPDGRRCRSEDEMIAIGMYLNTQGRWSQPRNGLSERLGSAAEATEQ